MTTITDSTNNSDRRKTSDDHNNDPTTTTAIADNIEALDTIAKEEEDEVSLEGFGSASITSMSADEEEEEEEDDNAYFRNQIIAEENERYTPSYTVIHAHSGDGGNGKRTRGTMRVTSEDIKFALDTMKKEAPYDIVSIKQLFFGMASAFTKCPIHHSVNSRKTGAGKIHDLTLVSGYFSKKYVIALAQTGSIPGKKQETHTCNT